MEAFDMALNWFLTTTLMVLLGIIGAAVLFFIWGVMVKLKARTAVQVALLVGIVASIGMPLLLVRDASREVETACASLPVDVEASDIRPTTLDERNIGKHCGAIILREIVNQARAT